MKFLAQLFIISYTLSALVSHAATYRFCNMSPQPVTIYGFPNWWYYSDSESQDFTIPQQGSVDIDFNGCIKDVYFGAPGASCTYDSEGNCTWNRISTCSSSTFVFGSSTNGGNPNWQGIDTVTDCNSAAQQILECSKPIPNTGTDCGCTEMGICHSTFLEYICALSCFFANNSSGGDDD